MEREVGSAIRLTPVVGDAAGSNQGDGSELPAARLNPELVQGGLTPLAPDAAPLRAGDDSGESRGAGKANR